MGGVAASAAGLGLVGAQDAKAELSKPLQTFVDAVDTAANIAEEASKKGSELIEGGKQVVNTVSPYADRAGKALGPVADSVGRVAGRTLAPIADDVTKKGSDALSSGVSSLDSYISSQGVDVAPVKSAFNTVVSEAPEAAKAVTPFLQSFFQAVMNSEPATLAEYLVFIYLAYLLLPFAGAQLGKTLRGYAGELSPPEALDMLMKDGNSVILDIRTQEEQEAKGILDLPNKSRKQLINMERTVLERGQFTNNFATEAQITAVQAAALKSTKQGKNLIVLDQTNKQAKAVAKELAKLGYSNVFVVKGGFVSWVAAQLQTKSSTTARADAVTIGGLRRMPAVAAPRPRRTVDVEVVSDFLPIPKGLPAPRK